MAYSGRAGSTHVDVTINERHRTLLSISAKYLTESLDMISKAYPMELIAQQLRRSLDCLGEVVGKTSTEDLLDKIFSTFCIGK